MTSETPRQLSFMQRALDALQGRKLYRQIKPIAAGAAPWVEINGQRLLNLSSNNYLGLANHPEVIAAAARAATAGCSTGASRLIAGTSDLHMELEARLARFKHLERALLFTSGYTANLSVIPTLVRSGDLICSDTLNHASLIDGCRLSRADYQIYPHNDIAALAKLLSSSSKTKQRRRLVVTDTVFSMDGDLAPLAEIAQLCRQYEAMLLVDEAHATGCLGPGGRGLAAQLGIEHELTLTMGTLSKGLGGFGAFVAGSRMAIEYLINVARGFIYTTALPLSIVATALAALDVLEQEPALIDRLHEQAAFLRSGLQSLGFDTLGSQTQIIPMVIGETDKALEMAAELRRAGVFVVAIRPPTVPLGAARIRASVMATHTLADLSFALEVFEQVGRRLGVI